MRVKLLTIVLFTLLIVIGFLLHSPAFAQNLIYSPNTTSYSSQNLHLYTQNVMLEVLAALSCQLTGIDPVNPKGQCLGIDVKNGRIGFVPSPSADGSGQVGGAIGVMGNLIAMTFQIPISTHDYTSYLASNFGIAKKGYAEDVEDTGGGSGAQQPSGTRVRAFTGTGFIGLGPFLALWRAFRNIVFLFFVFIFTIVGLGIMFRVRIDPRTIMTLQNQIPKIIIALVLVTFSYAIVGFLVDLMWLVTYLIFGVVSGASGPGVNLDVGSLNPVDLQGKNPFTALGGWNGLGWIAKDAAGGVGDVIGSLLNTGRMGSIITGVFIGVIGVALGGAVGGPLGFIIGPLLGLFGGGTAIFGLGSAIGLVGSVIAFIVIAIAILVSLFRLWFALLRSYVYILVGVILAPFWIGLGILPGSRISFGAWFRDVLANLSVFPSTVFMFLIGKAIIDSVGRVQLGKQFVPPLIGNPGDPNAVASLIGLGIILLTPQVVNMVRDALKAPTLKYTAAFGQAVGAGTGVVGAPVGTVGGVLKQSLVFGYGAQIAKHLPFGGGGRRE